MNALKKASWSHQIDLVQQLYTSPSILIHITDFAYYRILSYYINYLLMKHFYVRYD